jgi:hypothetical protein
MLLKVKQFRGIRPIRSQQILLYMELEEILKPDELKKTFPLVPPVFG